MEVIKFLDLREGYVELREELNEVVEHVMASGVYVLGSEVKEFEAEYARFCEARYCIGVASGLDALHLALLAVGVGPGDEVLVPSHTFVATWLAVSMCGAKPVPIEPELGGFNIDASLIERSLTSKTKAIVPVHLYGQPADINRINALASQYGLSVVEDAAQAHGATYKGRCIGSHSDVVAWSFYPTKNLGAFGDGGAVTTNNPAIADNVAVLRNYGSRVKYVNEVLGRNSRLDPIQAAVLRVKLKHLERWNRRRREIARLYREQLSELDLVLPQDSPETVWHLFVIRSAKRDFLIEQLANHGIQVMVHYPVPPHLQPAFSHYNYLSGAFPRSELLAAEILSLPIGPHLTDSAIEKVVSVLRSLLL